MSVSYASTKQSKNSKTPFIVLFLCSIVIYLVLHNASEDTVNSVGQTYEAVSTTAAATPQDEHVSTVGNTIKDRVAVIIETRRLDTLAPLVLHFSAVLGASWPVILYTIPENVPYYSSLPAMERSLDVSVRPLPSTITITSRDDVSALLTQTALWDELAPADYVLLFQDDSMICSNSPVNIDDFLYYDYVGAPIVPPFGRGMNGGLSLRNRNTILAIIAQHDWNYERHNHGDTNGYNYNFEDQWFLAKLEDMRGSRLPQMDVAMKFSVETLWYEKPLGFHQLERWQPDHVDEVMKWCPELSMTIHTSF